MKEIIKRLNPFEIALIIVLSILTIGWGFSNSYFYKDLFKPEFRNPNALLKIKREIPSEHNSTEGSKEIQIGNRNYIIPNNIINSFGVKNERQNFMGIIVSWPSMKAVANRGVAGIDVIDIKLEARKDIPRPASKSELERMIRSHHGEPVLLSQYNDLQEYPNRNYFPFYRAKNASIVWADGLPAYFYCGGYSISQQGLGELVSGDGRCEIQLIWPDSFNVNINFHKSHLAEWREIHDSVMTMLNSMEKNSNQNQRSLLIDN